MQRTSPSTGSALLALLAFIAIVSTLLLLSFQTTISERLAVHSIASSYQASLAAESGLAVAISELGQATGNNPVFLIGQTNIAATNSSEAATQLLLIGATHLTNSQQLLPLASGTISLLRDYPNLPPEALDNYEIQFQKMNRSQIVDLNKKNHPIAAKGSFYAPWVTLTNSSGRVTARYAYLFLDEQARLNPGLHHGLARNDPDHWDQGPATLPLSLDNDILMTSREATNAILQTKNMLTTCSLERAFSTHEAYENKKIYFTKSQPFLPELIPRELPEGGLPKYDLNDLATNSLYGANASERALTIAAIIDRNFPLFKERDPSLKNSSSVDQRRYLNRLAACIISYISPNAEPTLVNGGEPAGLSRFPLVTQIAERTQLKERSSNSVTIENQYFIQAWNPYTTPILEGSQATLTINNRQCLHFGEAPKMAFHDYTQSAMQIPRIGPNESIVIVFPSVLQTWTSPTIVPTSSIPSWNEGPEGNNDSTKHQRFEFFWNHQLVEMSRNFPVGPGLANGGLEHAAASLTNAENFWQCNFIPTEQDHAGHFRCVGDPRENYLSNYLWKSYASQTSYLMNTRWKGIMNDASQERLFNPSVSWMHRDFIPINPVVGNKPSSLSTTPDQVPSPYHEGSDGIMAPFVLRNAPMNSIVELGNINDPAQADDLGEAPLGGANEKQNSIYTSGGGRTLRIGQPEFSYSSPDSNWDLPGKRAIELIDLFTIAPTNSQAATKITALSTCNTNELYPPRATLWKRGLININTASHEVLTALFYGITPTSDRRFTNSVIALTKAEELATFLEVHRPYEKLSDLYIMTPLLANAMTYTPSLATNVVIDGQAAAAVFDRAREEGFAKMISHCCVQSYSFRLYVLGESLSPLGKPNGETMIEATITLTPQEDKLLSKDGSLPQQLLLTPIIEEKKVIR